MRPLCLFLLGPLLALAQLYAPSGVGSSASRVLFMQADEAWFSIEVTGAVELTPAKVVEMLQAAGLPAVEQVSNSVGSYWLGEESGETTQITMGFLSLTTADRYRDMARRLDELKAAKDKWVEGVVSVAYTGGLSISDRALEQARLRLYPELLAEARRKAELLASAAGIRLGPVYSLFDGTSPGSVRDSGFSYNVRYGGTTSLVQTFSIGLVYSRRDD